MNMWNIIYINECERISEIDSANANTTFGTTISKNYKKDRDVWKVKNNINLLVMWVDTPESMIQDKCDEFAK